MKEGWNYKKLVEVAVFINGDRGKNYPSQNDFVEKGIPFINAGHIKGNKVDFESMNYISKEKFNMLGSGKIQNGDILFCLRGSLGKKAIVNNIPEGAIASSLVIIRVSDIINTFLSYYLESPTIKKEIYKCNNGSSQPNLSAKSVSNFVIPIPSQAEQKHIVKELDLLSSIIEKKKSQLNELDNLAQSLFYEMFGDPITNEKGWVIKTISKIGCVITGSTPSTKEPKNYNSNDFCFIKPSDIGKDGITLINDSDNYISEYAFNNSRKITKGSILVTCIGIVGKVGLLEIDATCNQQINAIIPSPSVNSLYLAHCLLLSREVIESIANAPVVPIINKGVFSRFPIPLPPLSPKPICRENTDY